MEIRERTKKRSDHTTVILIGGLFLALWFSFILPYIASEVIFRQNIAEFTKAPNADAATVFSRVQYASGEGNPAAATFAATPISGNLLVAIAMHRVSTAGSAFTITGSGWTKRVIRDTLLTDTQARRSLVIWTKVAGASEPIDINVDNGTTDTIKVLIQEFSAGTAVTWTFENESDADTGTGSTSPLSTGSTTSISAGDLLLIGTAIWRNDTSGSPTGIGWTNSIGTTVEDLGAGNGRAINTGFVQDSVSGTKETAVSWTGSGHEATAAIIVFSVVPAYAPSQVVADPATLVQAYSALLYGKANPNSEATTGWFRYSTTNPNNCNDTFGTRVPGVGGVSLGLGSIQTSYSQSISGLLQNTTYYFCSIANNSVGTTDSGTDVESFTTPISLNAAPVISSVVVSPEPARAGLSRALTWDDRYTSLGGLFNGTSLSIESFPCDISDSVYIIQYKDGVEVGGVADISLTLPSTPAEGNLLVAVVSSSDGNVDITGPSGWTQAVEQAYTNRVRAEIWYRVAGALEPTALTFTQAATAKKALAVYEIAGMVTSSVLDRTQGENSTGSANSVAPGPTALTSQANELAFVSVVSDDGQGWSREFTGGFTYSNDVFTGNGGAEAATIIGLKLMSEIEAVGTSTSWENPSEQAAVIATFKADVDACSTTATTEEIRIVYYDETATSVEAAKYVGDASGSCTNTDWDCDTIAATGGAHGKGVEIAYDAAGNAWVAYQFVPTSANATIMVAQYVGSGGTCATNYGGSVAWNCTVVDDPAGAVGITTDVNGGNVGIAFDNSDNPWIVYYDITNTALKVAHFVGGGSGLDCGSGSSDWVCETVDGTSSDMGEQANRIAVDGSGKVWVVYRDNNNSALKTAQYIGSGGGSGCADADWTCEILENSSDDGDYVGIAINPGTGFPWVAYAQRTTNQLQMARYTGTGSESSCTGGSSNWLCSTVNSVSGLANQITIAFKSDATAWISVFDEVAAPDEMFVAEYVGSGGSCSNAAWDCEQIFNTTGIGAFPALAIDSSDVPWFSYGQYTANEVKVAQYVGSGGTGCQAVPITTKWTCTTVNGANHLSGNLYTSMAIRTGTTPSADIVFMDSDTSSSASSTTLTFTKANFTGLGDSTLLLAYLNKNDDLGGAWTVGSGETGWTFTGQQTTSGASQDDQNSAWAYKYVTTMASEPATWTFQTTDTDAVTGVMSAFTGVDPTVPIDAAIIATNGIDDRTPDTPDITTITDGAMVVTAHGIPLNWAETVGAPSGFTIANHIAATGAHATMAYQKEATLGAKTYGSWTNSPDGADHEWHVGTIAIRPLTAASCDPATWYDCNWQYRQKITTDHAKVGEGTFTLPGLTTDYVSTPDNAVLDITGDIDIRFKYAPTDWTPVSEQVIVAKWNPDSVNATTESWAVVQGVTGDEFTLYWRESDGTLRSSILSLIGIDLPPNDGSSLVVRITLDVEKSGQWETNIYTSSTDGATWKVAHDTDTGASGVSSIYSSTHDLWIGRGEVSGTDRYFGGNVYWVEIRDGINETIVANPNFTNIDQGDWALGSGVDGPGNVWTINGAGGTYNAPSDITNFPLYLDLSQFGSQFFAGVNSDGGDIRITTSDGTTEIAREIVSTDTAGETGEVYFLAPTISASADTDFYIYYGNSAASDYATTAGFGRNTVWTTAGYVGVWHLEDVCADAVSGCIVDSTGQNNATANNFQDGGGGTTDATGKLGGGDSFETGVGADDYHSFPAHASRIVGTTYTVSAWAKPSGVSSWNSVHSIFSSGYQPDLSFRGDDSSSPLGLRGLAYEATNSGTWQSYDCDDSLVVWKEDQWDYVGMSVNGTDVRVYENSSRRPNRTGGSDCVLASALVGTATNSGYIGAYTSSNPLTWEGWLDEIRFSDNTLSEEWMHTEYNSQFDTTTFVTYGGAESSTSSGSFISGTLTSLTLDTRSPNGVGMNSLLWRGTKPFGTSARFWIASSECPNGETNPPDCTTPSDPGIYEAFTGADVWDSSTWTSSPLLGGAADINWSWGRLSHTATAGSTARILNNMTPVNDSEVLTRFRYGSTNGGDAFRVFLRASGVWDATNTENPTTGYTVEYNNALNRFRLYAINGGALTQIGSDYIPTTSDAEDHQLLRFRVQGNQIKLRTWRYFAKEPTVWQIEATDSSVTGSGVLQMSLAASGANQIEEVILDDLYVSNPTIGAAGSGEVGNQWDYRGVSCSIDGVPYTPNSGAAVDIGCDSENYRSRYFRYKVQLCSTVNCLATGQFTPNVQDIIINWSL